MADNVVVTAGTGTTVAADEVVDGTLGTVKVQYVKIMDGTLDGTSKATVNANGLKVDGSAVTQPVSGTVTATVAAATITGGTVAHDAADTGNPIKVGFKAISGAPTAVASGDRTDGLTDLFGSVRVIQTNTTGTPIDMTSGTDGTPTGGVVSVQGSGTSMQPMVGVLKPRATANGSTSSRVSSAASTNATSLKASAGNIVNIDVFNVAAYDVFLKLYNKASAPTVGTDTPVWTIPIKTGTGFSREFVQGKSFATGIAYAITKLQADSDTTAVAASDLTGSIDWI